MTRPEVEEFISLVSNPDSPWGMADHDALELCNYILHLEAEAKRKGAALRQAALELDEAANIIRPNLSCAADLFVQAAARAKSAALTPATETGERK